MENFNYEEFTAEKAKSATNKYYENRNLEYQQKANELLESLLPLIIEEAERGLYRHTITKKAQYFGAQEIEKIVSNKLSELGYTIYRKDDYFYVDWC